MITLVTGGSGSGKSEYAEQLVLRSQSSRRYYVATMIVYGKEGREKVARHRMMRREKGFITLEQPRDVGNIVLEQPASAVLLECISNLAANEMFGERTKGGLMDAGPLAHKIGTDILRLSGQVRDLVIVTNEVDRDGLAYDRETMEYIRLMGLLNRRLAALADRVVEVVCGIPVALKQ